MIYYDYTHFEDKMKFFVWFLCYRSVSAIPPDNLAATGRIS